MYVFQFMIILFLRSSLWRSLNQGSLFQVVSHLPAPISVNEAYGVIMLSNRVTIMNQEPSNFINIERNSIQREGIFFKFSLCLNFILFLWNFLSKMRNKSLFSTSRLHRTKSKLE